MESARQPRPLLDPFSEQAPESPQIVFSIESQDIPSTALALALTEAGVELDGAVDLDSDEQSKDQDQQEILLTEEDIAFGEMLSEKFAELQPKLVWYLISKTSTAREYVEDAVQQAFEAAWKGRSKYFETDTVPDIWFYTVSFRALTREWRKHYKYTTTIDADELLGQVHVDNEDYSSTYTAILNGINSLPLQQKEVALRLIKGMKQVEIASDMQIKPGTARSHVRHLRLTMNALARAQGWR